MCTLVDCPHSPPLYQKLNWCDSIPYLNMIACSYFIEWRFPHFIFWLYYSDGRGMTNTYAILFWPWFLFFLSSVCWIIHAEGYLSTVAVAFLTAGTAFSFPATPTIALRPQHTLTWISPTEAQCSSSCVFFITVELWTFDLRAWQNYNCLDLHFQLILMAYTLGMDVECVPDSPPPSV